jgi:hypothetical protein
VGDAAELVDEVYVRVLSVDVDESVGYPVQEVGVAHCLLSGGWGENFTKLPLLSPGIGK